MDNTPFEIFLVATPGLEAPLAAEAKALGWTGVIQPGGVAITGGWTDVWRANLMLRRATRVLARIGGFRAMHLAQLDKRARKFPWADLLPRDLPVRVESICRASRIYHAGAATQRIERAITEELGAPLATPKDRGPSLTVKAISRSPGPRSRRCAALPSAAARWTS